MEPVALVELTLEISQTHLGGGICAKANQPSAGGAERSAQRRSTWKRGDEVAELI